MGSGVVSFLQSFLLNIKGAGGGGSSLSALCLVTHWLWVLESVRPIVYGLVRISVDPV